MFLTKFSVLILAAFAMSVGSSLPKNHTEPEPWDSRRALGSACLPCGYCSCCCGRCIDGRCFGRCYPPRVYCPRDASPVIDPDYGYGYGKGIPELKAYEEIKTTSPEECEARCKEEDQCKAIKWYRGRCYLMETVCEPSEKPYHCWIKDCPTPTTCSNSSTPSLNPSYDYFHAVCDDMIQVYMNGIYTAPVGGACPWPYPYRWKAYTYTIPPGTQVIAVSCLDVKQRRRYLVGSFSNGAITNSADWKCNNVRKSAWQTIDYDDSKWDNPIENAVNDGSEGYNYTRIDSSAKLIWTGSYVSTYPVGPDEMFCRFNYTAAAPGPAEDRVRGKPLPSQPN